MTDESGDDVATYAYDAYGNPAGSTGSAINPFGYNGQYTDNESGLQYLRARYYEPGTGQFLSRDPIEDITGQAYAYASGSPIDYVDPTGLISVDFNDIGNAVAGWGDNLTFGGTKKIRQLIGNDNVDYCSDAYAAGSGAGLATSFVIPGSNTIAAGRIAARAGSGAIRARRVLSSERGSVGFGDLPRRAKTFSDFEDAAKHLGRFHGVDRADASARLHAIKQASGLRGSDNVLIDRTGNVYNANTRELLGSLTRGGG